MNEIKLSQFFESMVVHEKLMHIQLVHWFCISSMPMTPHQPVQNDLCFDLNLNGHWTYHSKNISTYRIHKSMAHQNRHCNQMFGHWNQHKEYCSLVKYTVHMGHNRMWLKYKFKSLRMVIKLLKSSRAPSGEKSYHMYRFP